MNNDRHTGAFSILGVLAILACLALPLARACGLWNWWVVGGIVLGTLLGALLVSGFHVSTQEDVDRASAQVLEGQQYTVRSLRYRLPVAWRTTPEKTGSRVKHTAPNLELKIVVAVDWIHPEEDNSPASVQRFAEKYVKEDIGGEILRNEIRTLCGYRCVDFDYRTRDGKRFRRITFVFHRSEYYILFITRNETVYQRLRPLIETILGTCEVVLPRLPLQSALGNRVLIGIPTEWSKIRDDDMVNVWRGETWPIEVRLYFVQKDGCTRLGTDVFRELPDPRSHGPLQTQEYDMLETGARVLTGVPQQGRDNWSVHALQLSSGLVVVLEVDHRGRETDLFEGFLTRTAFITEILATVQDGPIE